MKRSSTRAIVLDYDAAELHPEETTRSWFSKLTFSGKHGQPRLHLRGGSIILEADEASATGIIEALKARKGPPNLVWALVPTTNPAVPIRLKGEAFDDHVAHLKQSIGRRTKLNALPDELGERYWKSMTYPDYGHDD